MQLHNMSATQLLDSLPYDATPRKVKDIDDFFLPQASQ